MSIPDPWEEQRRRAREHRRQRRRRRALRVWLPIGAVVLLAAGGVSAWLLLDDDTVDDHDGDTVSEVMPSTPVTVTAVPATDGGSSGAEASDDEPVGTPPATTGTPAARPVEVEEVWLLDRGDGEFDWGLLIEVPDGGETRSDVAVRVRLVDAADTVLDTVERSLVGVDDGAPTAVAGRFSEADGVPVRLDFDVTIGVVSDDPGLPDLLDTRAVEREDDELRGRIRSASADDVTDVAMVLVWRDDEVDESGGPADDPEPIVDVVVYDIERLRAGVDARFEIDLADLRTPDGLPDDVFWSPID